MMSNPSVTVLIPFYNSQAYLKAAIDSVLRQTFADLELLLVDDASTDASRAIVQDYDDPRLRLICNDKNRGVVYSRNRGLEEAKAPIIALLDADDVAMLDRIASQHAYMKSHPQLMMVGGAGRSHRCTRHFHRRVLPHAHRSHVSGSGIVVSKRFR